MTVEGNSPLVQMEKEPEPRTQQYNMKINPTTTTVAKEDEKDSTAILQQATITAKKEDATDSTADRTLTINQLTTSRVAKEDDTDPTTKSLFSTSLWDKIYKEGQSETDTTTTMAGLTTSTGGNRNGRILKPGEEWRVPSQIVVIRDDLGPQEGFNFMGEDVISCEQTRPKLGTAIRHVEGQYALGHYMDAYQDYSSMKRKIVKPSKKWCAPTNKPKELKFSSNTNQNTPLNSRFIFGNAPQGRTGANAPSPKPQTMPNRQTVSGVFMFGYTAKEMRETKTSPLTPHELSRHQKPVENQVQPEKKPSPRSRVGKFKVDTKKSQGTDQMGNNTTKKRRGSKLTPRKINLYKLCD